MKNGLVEKQGITLIALVVTIVVLLILAGITIGTLTGENGILLQTLRAKERGEIANEKEVLEISTVQAMEKDKYGSITKIKLQTQLDENTSKGATSVEEDEDVLLATFVESKRVYQVDEDGNITYLGEEDELLTQATIEASPESNSTPELVQSVDLIVKTPISIPDENITLVYAWSNSENIQPEESEYIKATLTGTKKRRTAKVSSNATEKGDYYLWAKVIIGEKEIDECFGPYAIKDHTTLVASNDQSSTSYFLESTTIVRNQIESVTIATSLGTHTTADENCWDVSQSQDGTYLAWYEDNDEDGYYEVTIAGEGGVVANSMSSGLFSYIGYNGDDTTVFYGLENLDTGLVTNMAYMFNSCTNLTSINVSKFNTSNVTGMREIFNGCSNLTNLDLSNWDTSNVTNMSYMFRDCTNLTSLDVSGFDTGNATLMSGMFWRCTKLVNIDVSNFDTSNVTSMAKMFSGCGSLTSLSLSNFDTSNVTNMSEMFAKCSGLTSLDLSNSNTNNVTNMNKMFYGCSNLTSLNLSNFNTNKVTNMSNMFYYVPSTIKIKTNSTMAAWIKANFEQFTDENIELAS